MDIRVSPEGAFSASEFPINWNRAQYHLRFLVPQRRYDGSSQASAMA